MPIELTFDKPLQRLGWDLGQDQVVLYLGKSQKAILTGIGNAPCWTLWIAAVALSAALSSLENIISASVRRSWEFSGKRAPSVCRSSSSIFLGFCKPSTRKVKSESLTSSSSSFSLSKSMSDSSSSSSSIGGRSVVNTLLSSQASSSISNSSCWSRANSKILRDVLGSRITWYSIERVIKKETGSGVHLHYRCCLFCEFFCVFRVVIYVHVLLLFRLYQAEYREDHA